MKALTLTQPRATLVAIGAKRIETRSWNTRYHGQLAIHAAKGFPRDCKELFSLEGPFRWTLLKYGITSVDQLPLGVIVAIAGGVDCVPVDRIPLSLLHQPPASITVHEKYFGDYSAGRFGWILHEVRALKVPIPCKGALGLWEVPAGIAEGIAGEAFL